MNVTESMKAGESARRGKLGSLPSSAVNTDAKKLLNNSVFSFGSSIGMLCSSTYVGIVDFRLSRPRINL